MEKIKTDIYTIGHKNPDADSVCSAIAMAELRGCIAAAAGNLNRETEYILETFGVKGPVILDDLTGKTLILVDHNKLEHAAKGIECAEIIEIVDHHFMGGPESMRAPKVRNQILGSTAAIVCGMYEEEGVKPDKKTAGVLLGAIISDTLFFKSPNTTEDDIAAAGKLAEIAGVDMADFAEGIFGAASNLEGKSIREIFYQDYKVFRGERSSFGCGALTVPDADKLGTFEEDMLNFMKAEAVSNNGQPDFILFMLTSLIKEKTTIICADERAKLAVTKAYEKCTNGHWISEEVYSVDQILSRKTQLVPQVTEAADEIKQIIKRKI